MPKPGSKRSVQLAVVFIDEQLSVLLMYATSLSHWIGNRESVPNVDAVSRLMSRKRLPPGDETSLEGYPPHSLQQLGEDPSQVARLSRVVGSNAILAVAEFFEAHDMSVLRTPEIQFLMHLRDAITNANTFEIRAGEYFPAATFDGLPIDASLDGSLLFSDGVKPGFFEFGDVVDLLQYLSRYLRDMQHLVSGGDAG